MKKYVKIFVKDVLDLLVLFLSILSPLMSIVFGITYNLPVTRISLMNAYQILISLVFMALFLVINTILETEIFAIITEKHKLCNAYTKEKETLACQSKLKKLIGETEDSILYNKLGRLGKGNIAQWLCLSTFVSIISAVLAFLTISKGFNLYASANTILIFITLWTICFELSSFLIHKLGVVEWLTAKSYKKRLLVKSIFATILCIISLCIVPKAYGKICTYNMYWEGGHRDPFEYEYTINKDKTLKIYNNDGFAIDSYTEVVDLMPKQILTNFVDNGWYLKIDSDWLAEYSWLNNGKRYGPLQFSILDDANKTITVHSNNHIAYEFGRYYYRFMTDHTKIDELIAADYETIKGNITSDTYGNEFKDIETENIFAMLFTKYALLREEDLRSIAPHICDYFEKEVFIMKERIICYAI